MSENLKLRLDSTAGETPSDRITRSHEAGNAGILGPGEPAQIDEAESQMRKALGLLGETPRHRPDGDRMEQPGRMSDRFNGGLHRRRFVQDGDIPVTVLRRDQSHEAPVHRGVAAPPAPTSSRLQRTEAALAAETAAREKAERALAETQSVARDLQTKIGHAELAKTEAIEALRRERESSATLRAELDALQERVREAEERAQTAEHNANAAQEQLAEERHARKTIEKTLRATQAARDAAEQLVRTLSEEVPVRVAAPQQKRQVRTAVEPEVVAVPVRRGRVAAPVVAEPEPVKWWLNTKPVGKKR